MQGPASFGIVTQLIVVSSVPGTGVFIYSPTPGLGNLIAVFAGAAGEDTYGNVYPQGSTFGVWSATGVLGQHFNIDSQGNTRTADSSGVNRIITQPFQNLPFNLTSALTGIFTSAMQLSSSDPNEVTLGEFAAVQIGTGSSAKMSTVLMSPFGSSGTGTALLLQSENDGGTDTSIMTICTVTSQGGSLIFEPIAAFFPGGFILYSGGGTITVTTITAAGSGTIPIPAGITSAYAESWAAGGGGYYGTVGALIAGSGGGGGEYAAEPALVVPSGGTVAYVVGAAGAGGVKGSSTPPTGGSDSTLTGSAVTVHAHGGGAAGPSLGGAGGSGSTNTVAFFGGAGWTDPSGSAPQFGGGGGSSAGTTSVGNNGNGNFGATPVTGGGPGGNGFGGGTAGDSGSAPASGPGGGGGGGSNIAHAADNGGAGWQGQVRLTYTTGAPAISFSNAAAAGTDQFGTSYPAGMSLAGSLRLTQQTADFTHYVVTQASTQQASKAWSIAANDAKAGTKYRLTTDISGTQGSTQQKLVFQDPNGNAICTLTPTFVGVSAAFGCKVIMEVTVITAGASGTCDINIWAVASGANVTGAVCVGWTTGVTLDTAAAWTLEQQAWWGATTGGPTLTSYQSQYERIGP
jgi:hypothetical protein